MKQPNLNNLSDNNGNDNHSQSDNQENHSSDYLNSLIENLFKGNLNAVEIDPTLTAATAQTLMDAVITAYQASLLGKPMPNPSLRGGSVATNEATSKNAVIASHEVAKQPINFTDFTTPHTNALNNIAKNVYQFSVAKNYHELRELTDLLKNGDKTRSYADFRKEALHIHNYYDQHLRTEYNTALSGAYNAASWTDYEESQNRRNAVIARHGVPKQPVLLQFQTAGDSHVRASHKLLDGIVRPMNDPFWNTHMPPLDWNCRCTTVQLTDNESEASLRGTKQPIPNIKIPKLFQTNLAKQNLVFPLNHPYFKDCPKSELLKGIYNLPVKDQYIHTYTGKTGGTVHTHVLADTQHRDYAGVLAYAKHRADNGDIVEILAPIGDSYTDARNKILPKTKGTKNPDLRINAEYVDAKIMTGNNLTTLQKNIDLGSTQADYIYISTPEPLSDEEMLRRASGSMKKHENLQNITFGHGDKYVLFARKSLGL